MALHHDDIQGHYLSHCLLFETYLPKKRLDSTIKKSMTNAAA